MESVGPVIGWILRGSPKARGSNTIGFRPNAWHYRDYVIRAFNDDKPYNTFLQEQIAGDVLSTETRRKA